MPVKIKPPSKYGTARPTGRTKTIGGGSATVSKGSLLNPTLPDVKPIRPGTSPRGRSSKGVK